MSDPGPQEPRIVGAERVLAVLVELARHPAGASLGELAAAVESSKPTVHRALSTLKRAKLASQDGRGTYVLGDEFIRLAAQHRDQRPDVVLVEPLLRELAIRFGETAHFAVLDKHDVVYRAKVDPPEGSVKLSSFVGGRNPSHVTAVGKLLLSIEVPTRDELAARFVGATLVGRTPHSITDIDSLWSELERTRSRGYALDAQENELGINCIAMAFRPAADELAVGAVSVSALAFRTPLDQLVRRHHEIRAIIEAHS